MQCDWWGNNCKVIRTVTVRTVVDFRIYDSAGTYGVVTAYCEGFDGAYPDFVKNAQPVTRTPTDVALWRDALIEFSTLENVRPYDGLLQQIDFGPAELEVTLTTGERLTIPSAASREEMAQAISAVLGEAVVANPDLEWAPPYKTENFWWAETLYNFGVLAPNGIVMKSDVLFHRISRRDGVAMIEASDAHHRVTVEFDLTADVPPVDTVTDVLEALSTA